MGKSSLLQKGSNFQRGYVVHTNGYNGTFPGKRGKEEEEEEEEAEEEESLKLTTHLHVVLR